MPRIEIAHPNCLAQLLAPSLLPPTGGLLCPQPLATAGYSSESSNSATGPPRRESDECNSNVIESLYDISVVVYILFNFLTICNCCLDP